MRTLNQNIALVSDTFEIVMDIVTKFVNLIEFEDSRLNTRCDNLSRRLVKQNEETNEKSTKLSS